MAEMWYCESMRSAVQIHKSRSTGGNAIVAANVRAQIAYADMNQGQLAEILGLSKMAASRRLNDETEFSAGEILLVADYFGIEPGDLFIRRGGVQPSPPTALVGPAGTEPTTSTV